MNTPVNFELAKLLKEKEYKREEGYSYVIVNTDILNHSVGDNYISYSIGSLLKYSIKEKTIPAPTIAEVVMWLYEKHGIWISVEQNIYENRFDYLITITTGLPTYSCHHPPDHSWQHCLCFHCVRYMGRPA